jgi:NitT/TauT family transport system substrate-binding protein
VRILAATLSCLLLAAGCQDRAPSRAPVPITIASSMNFQGGLMHLAVGRGLLGAHGLDATVQPHAFGKLALEAMLRGQADVATVAETPVVLAALRGEPLAVIATIATATRSTVVVARREAGIAVARDLAGKKVGLPHGTTADFFLDSLLLRHGVDRSSLREVELRPEQMGDALARGEVDAVAVWYPTVATLQQRLGERAVLLDAADIYFETYELVARPEWVRRHRPAAERLLAALLEAEALVRRQPDGAHREMAAALGVAPGLLPSDLMDFRVRLDQSLLVLMEEQARWALRAGLVVGAPPRDLLGLLEPGPLAAVRPDSVRLIR